jgi:chromosome segregation ATPase
MADEDKDKVIQELQADLKTERDKRKVAEGKVMDLEKAVAERENDIAKAEKRMEGVKSKLGEYESRDKRDEAFRKAKDEFLKKAKDDGKSIDFDEDRARDAYSRLTFNEEKIHEDAAWAVALGAKEKTGKTSTGTALGGQPSEGDDKNKKAEPPNATKWLLDVIDGKDPR